MRQRDDVVSASEIARSQIAEAFSCESGATTSRPPPQSPSPRFRPSNPMRRSRWAAAMSAPGTGNYLGQRGRGLNRLRSAASGAEPGMRVRRRRTGVGCSRGGRRWSAVRWGEHVADRYLGARSERPTGHPVRRTPRALQLSPGHGHLARVQYVFRRPGRGRGQRGQRSSGKSRIVFLGATS